MTYEEARAFIDDTAKYGYVLGLDTVRELLARLHNPQDELKFVHIAGTNGKGSTLAYISTILKEAGYRVGRYISPTIFDYRERIQVNEEYISREAVARLARQVQEAGEQMRRDGLPHPTTFEVETAMAFLYFREMNCDLVVLECGMGGLTDATNVVKNTLVCVFAEIGMDHMDFLGNTIGEIAQIKAGILKPGAAAVSAPQRPEAAEVLRKACEETGTRLRFVRKEELTDVRCAFEDQSFSYKKWKGLRPGLMGSWQIDNAALAVETVEALGERGFPVTEDELRRGLAKTVWPGRFTTVSRQPLLIADGAHNPDAADRLRETLELYFPDRRKIFIIGVLADKNYDYMVSRLAPLAERIVTVETPDNPRALPAAVLAEDVRKYNARVEASESIPDALRRARACADGDDLILAFGSLSYLGALMREARDSD